MKFYYKKVSKQDVIRTFVVNTEAIKSYFHMDLAERDEVGCLTLIYRGAIHIETKIIKKQDFRLFIDKSKFLSEMQVDDILQFIKLNDDIYYCNLFENDTINHNIISGFLNSDNYCITNYELL